VSGPGAGRPKAARAAARLGLRGRLALSIAAIIIAAIAITFFAVYRGTGSALRGRIDRDLRAEVNGLATAAGRAPGPAAATAAAHRYIASQPFGPAARLLIASFSPAPTLTNQPDLVAGARENEGESKADRRRERAQAGALTSTPNGFSTVTLTDAGQVRMLTRTVDAGGRRLTIRAGEPLAPVSRAESDVSRTFLIVGAVTLAAALLAGYILAARTAAPLRRIARVAAAVDAGDLAPRIGDQPGAAEEVRVLAESFDHMLDRLDQAFLRQREFVSDASHELRTPLTAIRGQLEVLAAEKDPPPAEIRRVEGLVLTELGRIERLVSDLLTLARLDEGPGLRIEPVTLPAAIERLLGDEALGAGVSVGELPSGTVPSDPDRFAQVLRNLLRNARQHCGPDGRVAVSAVAADGELVIRVDDDGPGIPAVERDRVFDRFHRLDSSRTRDLGGSGLGLAIVRSIVELHGGRIWAEDSPLGGARISFSLPGWEPRGGDGA
jgi:two-component system, OmpR family, sensor kinase